MKTIKQLVILLVLTGLCMAQPAPSDTESTAKKPKAHAAKKEVKATPAASAEDVKQLKEMIQSQQAEIDQLKQQAAQRDQQNSQAVTDAQKAAAAAQEKAAAAETTATDASAKADAAKSDVADLKTTTANTVVAVQETQKRESELETPKTIHYKNINITPGGFIAAEALWRQHAENNDIISQFNSIPYKSDERSHLTEFRMSARQSRLSLLAEGKAGSAKLTGYWEMDFLGAAPTANENQSTSFTPRERQLWGQVAMKGWSLTAGQTWSLITTNKAGIEARGEWVPATIDGQYVVGYDFARLMTARLTKTFGEKKTTTVAFAVENPATIGIVGSTSLVYTGGAGVGSLQNGAGTGSTGGTFSTNLAPDLIAKIAFDPGYGHYEIKALGRYFRDRVLPTTGNPSGTNNTKFGGGLGLAAILPVVPKKIDIIAEGLYGRGVARYGDSSTNDITIRPDGNISPIMNIHALAGLEAHPTPKFDLYVYGGDEYLSKNVYTIGSVTSGYGVPTTNIAPCFAAESASPACAAVLKNLAQGTMGFWWHLYKGGFGSMRYGMQYSYTNKTTWQGANGTGGALIHGPRANEAMVMSSFRYYLP